jgi:2-C-methyl-D-erythritol 2,4-cyclodiphosphate synthase
MRVRTGLGQDSHRFAPEGSNRPLRIGGVLFEGHAGLDGNSDADVALHALVNALSGVHGEVVLGSVTDRMCAAGVTDSGAYVRESLARLRPGTRLQHVSISLECRRPPIAPKAEAIRASVAALLGLELRDVAVTAHSGEGLSAVGRGEGIYATVLVTALED